MPTPTLVIHGVNNRDAAAFQEQARQLGDALGRRLIPVYWGDLGARTDAVRESIPPIGDAFGPDDAKAFLARAPIAASAAAKAGFARGLAAGPTSFATRSEDDELAREFEAAWQATQWLSRIEDPTVAAAIGEELGQALAGGESSDPFVRGAGAGRLKALLRALVGSVDKATGAVVEWTLGSLNQYLRREVAPSVAAFLGDAFVYEEEPGAIQGRLLEVLGREAPGYGTAERPVNVLAHSFGGVVAFDLAVRSDAPLHVDRFVTFGSQPAFFHSIDPRPGLAPFTPPDRVQLPTTIGRWLNLWQPLDPLAFIVGKIFSVPGDGPTDQRIPHRFSDGLYTHSDYWKSEESIAAMKDFL
jgi:hypothetical protein